MNTTYVIPNVVSVVCDRARSGRSMTLVSERYFHDGYDLFAQQLDLLRRQQRAPVPSEERTLRFMLEALIDAKHRLYATS